MGGLAVRLTTGPSGHAISPHPSSREGHHSTARCPIPLQPFVERLVCTPLFKGLADPQTTSRWMTASSLLVESTNPSTADIVVAISPKYPVYLFGQRCCAMPIFLIARPLKQLKEIANCECVCPKVSPLLFLRLR